MNHDDVDWGGDVATGSHRSLSKMAIKCHTSQSVKKSICSISMLISYKSWSYSMIIFNDHSYSFIMFYHLLPMFHPLEVFATADADAAASCTAEGSRSATRFSSSLYWFKAARCAWPLFIGGDVSIFHGKKMQHSEYWNPPSLIIFDQSQKKSQYFSSWKTPWVSCKKMPTLG